MANLRTNNLSGEQGQNAYRGSVFFNATPNAGLQMLSSDFAFGTGDFTVEGWFWYSGDGATIASIFDSRTTDTNTDGFFVGVNASGKFYTYGFRAGTGESAHNTIHPNSGWHHFAAVRSGNSGFRFLNGQQVGATEDMSSTNYTESGGTVGQPSNVFSSALYRWKGYLSNIRVHKGEAIYTSNFTPPTTELKATSSNCVLLCCQDSDDPTQDATGKSITAQNLISGQPKKVPPFGVDAGNTFGGPIQQSTEGYMYFPTGGTEERGRGRGVLSGGRNNHAMQFVNIQSQGNSIIFGDSVTDDGIEGFAVGSSTRGLFSGGFPSVGNVIEFITFATTSNGTDFGDMTTARRSGAGAGNETRGLFAGGLNSSGTSLNTIEFSTIPSLGNSTDFGDLTQARDQFAGCSDTTRAIFAGGVEQGASQHNIMDFVTIATTGNAQDFGDMTGINHGSTGSSNSTRGVLSVAYTSPTYINTIDFITIQSAGNAQNFGDLTLARYLSASMSNSIRAVFAGGGSPSATNTIDFVTIATRGDALDFGDLIGGANFVVVGTSDSHGGLS